MKTITQTVLGVASIVLRQLQHAALAGLGAGVYNVLVLGRGGSGIADRFLWGFGHTMEIGELFATAILIRGLVKSVEGAQHYERPARSFTTGLAAALGAGLAVQLFSSNPGIVGIAAVVGGVLGLAAGWLGPQQAFATQTAAQSQEN